jgi:hypothetical protein
MPNEFTFPGVYKWTRKDIFNHEIVGLFINRSRGYVLFSTYEEYYNKGGLWTSNDWDCCSRDYAPCTPEELSKLLKGE